MEMGVTVDNAEQQLREREMNAKFLSGCSCYISRFKSSLFANPENFPSDLVMKSMEAGHTCETLSRQGILNSLVIWNALIYLKKGLSKRRELAQAEYLISKAFSIYFEDLHIDSICALAGNSFNTHSITLLPELRIVSELSVFPLGEMEQYTGTGFFSL